MTLLCNGWDEKNSTKVILFGGFLTMKSYTGNFFIGHYGVMTCSLIDSHFRNKTGPLGTFWKLARIGERLSPWVAMACLSMAVHVLFIADS